MVIASKITTAEQLLSAGDIGRCELIRGNLMMMTPAGNEHGAIASRLTVIIGGHVMQHDLGEVFAAETGFTLERNPDTVRAPDVAFITKARVPDPIPKGFGDILPDLVVEVNSPDDRASYVLDKVQQWLAAGVKLVWVVDPKTKTVTAHHPDGTSETLDATQPLTAPDLLPGFSHPIGKIFE